MKLTTAEEQVMKFLWKLERAFIRNIINEFSEPKPAQTTVITLLKRMIDKGFVSYNQYGNSREYYPLISKRQYFSNHLNKLIKDHFNDSAGQFASFFANESNLSSEELEELRELVDKKLSSRNRKK